MPEYKLLAKAQIDGAVRDIGYIFTLPAGVRGPHRSIWSIDDGAWIDKPLFEEIVEKAAPAKSKG